MYKWYNGYMDSVKELGTILGIWAHPDDETWASAGLMTGARDNGQRVVCLVATDGGAGKTDDSKRWPKSELRETRLKEMRNALQIMGVKEVHLLGYEDGSLGRIDKAELVAELAKHIAGIKPDTVLTFEPNGITGHDDHKVISWAAKQAAQRSAVPVVVYGACETRERYDQAGCECNEKFDVYFNTDKPSLVTAAKADLLITLTPAAMDKKRRALQAHTSQTSKMFEDDDGKCYIDCLCQQEAFIRLN